MEFFEQYNEFVSNYQNGKENISIAYGIEWLAEAEENPFKSDTKERELFFNAKRMYRKWNNKAVDAQRSRKLMQQYLIELAKMNLPNPYVKEKVLGVIENKSVEQRTEQVVATEKRIEKQESQPNKNIENPNETIGEIKKRFFKHNKGDEQR